MGASCKGKFELQETTTRYGCKSLPAVPNQAVIVKAVYRSTVADLSVNLTQLRLGRCLPNRKNALFYKTEKGAQVGDSYMSLIHTAELCAANDLDYLTQLQKHVKNSKPIPSDGCPGTIDEVNRRAYLQWHRSKAATQS
jgi:hypothetical protein